MHAGGGIAPSGMAVVVKEPSGQWLVKEKTAGGALGTVVDALIGGFAGAAGGPVGAAIGAAGGALVGGGADLIHVKAATAFVDQVAPVARRPGDPRDRNHRRRNPGFHRADAGDRRHGRAWLAGLAGVSGMR